jgi:uncharacterized protein (TIGR03066 family)
MRASSRLAGGTLPSGDGTRALGPFRECSDVQREVSMTALRMVLVGCLVLLGLAGCSKFKAKVTEAVKKEAERQEKAKAAKKIVGRWQPLKDKDDTGRWWELTKDGKMKYGIQGPDDEAPSVSSGLGEDTHLVYEVEGDKLKISVLKDKKPHPEYKPATLTIKTLTDTSLVLEGDKGDFSKGEINDFFLGEYKKLGPLPTTREKVVGAWELVKGDGTDWKVVAELAADGKYKMNAQPEGSGPVTIEGTYEVDGKKLKTTMKDKTNELTIKKLTQRTLVLEDDKGKTQELKRKTGAAPTLIGTWEAVKGEGAAKGLELDLTKKDVYSYSVKALDGRIGSFGKSVVKGDKIEVQFGVEPLQTKTIKLLTENRLVLTHEDGKTDEFKRK